MGVALLTEHKEMSTPYSRIFRHLFKRLDPIPTDVEPVLAKLESVRAVLFDLYGTLFVSGSGDVGVLRESACEKALAEAFEAVGVSSQTTVERFLAAIDDSHRESRLSGVDYPEVDIVRVWRRVLDEAGGLDAAVDVKRLAVEYEARANPVWPMPGMADCLAALRRRGLVLGIISNAQFYTHELFPSLLGKEAEELGFERRLQIYSYQHGWGKPSARLFQPAVAELRGRSIEPQDVLFVGNDMLNDIFPAARAGFRTALFAGDARSLRLRADDGRVSKIVPDLILTDLGQLDGCIMEE